MEDSKKRSTKIPLLKRILSLTVKKVATWEPHKENKRSTSPRHPGIGQGFREGTEKVSSAHGLKERPLDTNTPSL